MTMLYDCVTMGLIKSNRTKIA